MKNLSSGIVLGLQFLCLGVFLGSHQYYSNQLLTLLWNGIPQSQLLANFALLASYSLGFYLSSKNLFQKFQLGLGILGFVANTLVLVKFSSLVSLAFATNYLDAVFSLHPVLVSFCIGIYSQKIFFKSGFQLVQYVGICVLSALVVLIARFIPIKLIYPSIFSFAFLFLSTWRISKSSPNETFSVSFSNTQVMVFIFGVCASLILGSLQRISSFILPFTGEEAVLFFFSYSILVASAAALVRLKIIRRFLSRQNMIYEIGILSALWSFSAIYSVEKILPYFSYSLSPHWIYLIYFFLFSIPSILFFLYLPYQLVQSHGKNDGLDFYLGLLGNLVGILLFRILMDLEFYWVWILMGILLSTLGFFIQERFDSKAVIRIVFLGTTIAGICQYKDNWLIAKGRIVSQMLLSRATGNPRPIPSLESVEIFKKQGHFSSLQEWQEENKRSWSYTLDGYESFLGRKKERQQAKLAFKLLVDSNDAAKQELVKVVVLGWGGGQIASQLQEEISSRRSLDSNQQNHDYQISVIERSPNYKNWEFTQRLHSISGISNFLSLRLIDQDVRRFLYSTSEKFDLVIWNLSDPMGSDLSTLYTAPIFSRINFLLKPNGIFVGRLEHAFPGAEMFCNLRKGFRTFSIDHRAKREFVSFLIYRKKNENKEIKRMHRLCRDTRNPFLKGISTPWLSRLNPITYKNSRLFGARLPLGDSDE